MSKMTLERATEFGSAWNSRDPDLIASYFTDDGVYHASVGLEHMGASFVGKDEIRKGAQTFFDRFPNGRFEKLQGQGLGRHGLIRMGFVTTEAEGAETRIAGCDLLEFVGDKVKTKNAFRKVQPLLTSRKGFPEEIVQAVA